MIDYSFCMVNWNGGETFLRSVRSILSETEGLNAEVIIVDNGSADGSVESLPLDGRIRTVLNGTNTYFARATNQSVAAARGRFLVVLNNDVVFYKDSLRYYLTVMEQHPGSILCPRLVNADGSTQKSIRNILTPQILLNEMFRLSSRPALRWIRDDFDYEQAQLVEQPLFSLLFMSRETFYRVGAMDCAYPLFFNDVDWYRRASKRAIRTRYVPGPAVLHEHGYSTAKKPFRKVWMSTVSMLRYMYRNFTASFFLLIPLIVAGGLYRMSRECRYKA